MVTFVWGQAKSRRCTPFQRGQWGSCPASDVEHITSQICMEHSGGINGWHWSQIANSMVSKHKAHTVADLDQNACASSPAENTVFVVYWMLVYLLYDQKHVDSRQHNHLSLNISLGCLSSYLASCYFLKQSQASLFVWHHGINTDYSRKAITIGSLSIEALPLQCPCLLAPL